MRRLLVATCAIVVAVLMLADPPGRPHDARAFVPPSGPPPISGDTTGFDLRVLTYNIHALPELIAGDNPRGRLPLIGDRIGSRYDVALLQEHFEFPRHLTRALSATPFSLFQGNGPVVEPSLAARLIHFLASIPGRILVGRSTPLDSGLTTLIMNQGPLRATPLVRRPFGVCDGYIFGKSDCLASKGVLGVRLEGAGVSVDLYNTHLDSRGDSRNHHIRRRQIEILTEEIRRHSADRAVIVAGDFNSRLREPRDRRLLRSFRESLNLTDAGARRSEAWGRPGGDLDYILYRSGETVELVLAEVGEDDGFRWREDSEPLSDHPALFAHFNAEPRTVEIARVTR